MKKSITVLFLLLLTICGAAIISSCGSVPKVSDDASDFGKGAAVAQTFDVTNADQWNAAIETINGGGNDKNYVINVTGTITLPGIGDDGGTFTRAHRNVKISLRGVGGTLALSGAGSLIKLAAGEHLTLRNITLRGFSDNTRSLVKIGRDAFLTMKDGAIITGNSGWEEGGGGVSVSENATFTMDGGAISNNVGLEAGGGVFVNNDGTFTMNGGTISDNRAHYDHAVGGGVYVSRNATFTMNGGIISGNYVSSSDMDAGGGVLVSLGGTFTMNNGTISGNTSNAHGGGVSVSGTFTMNDGTISGNTSKEFTGGGVSVSGTFTMNGGTISSNTTVGRGGGVYVVSGTFTMNEGTISGNTTNGYSGSGGGVYVFTNATFTMNGGIISGNTATGGTLVFGQTTYTQKGTCGGVCVGANQTAPDGGTFIMNGGIIYGSDGGTKANTAEEGASLYVARQLSTTDADGEGQKIRFTIGKEEKEYFTIKGSALYGDKSPILNGSTSTDATLTGKR